ncbi:MAG: GNAT family N-acetyltransferase [Pirellulaceae bacterium]
MNIERIASWSDAAGLRDEWNRLAGGIPFRQWEWLGTWWQHYGADRHWYVLAVRDAAGRLAGIAPWCQQSQPAFGRVVQFLGSGETCTDHLSVLCDERDRPAVTTALAQWLCEASFRDGDAGWDMLHLDGVVGDDAPTTDLLRLLESEGCTVHRRSDLHVWRIALPATWDAYRSQLSKPNRRHFRVLQERLIDPGLVKVQVARTSAQLDSAWTMLVDLHQRRRHELGQPGCFASPAFGAFARQAAEAFFERGQLELSWVEQGGAPLAVQLGFVGAQTTYAYQVGIDPLRRADSPGWLVHGQSIQRAIELGHTTFDFLRGDEPHKHRMGARATPLNTVRVVAPRLGPKMLHTAWATGDAVKNWIKSGLQMAGMRS